jgi:hypothetical protein
MSDIFNVQIGANKMKILFDRMFKKDLPMRYIFDAYQPSDKTLLESESNTSAHNSDKPEKNTQLQVDKTYTFK